jgi:pre-mRNA-splicing factor CWC26
VVESKEAMFKPVGAPPPKLSPSPEPAEAPDEAPQVVSVTEDVAPAPTKRRGGLQSAADLAAENARRKARAEAARREAEEERAAAARDGGEDAHETVYRDAEGKRIDTKAERAKQKRAREKAMEKEMERMEWGKGLVQREDKEARRRELEEIAAKPVARFVILIQSVQKRLGLILPL